MTSCPCCSNQLLRHIRHQEVYWFCTSCWQEMPNLDSLLKNDKEEMAGKTVVTRTDLITQLIRPIDLIHK